MPAQTTKTANIYFPDGCLFSIQPVGDPSFYDVGAISSAVTNTLNWEENQVETANAGKTAKQIRNMTIAGAFTLINLEPTGVSKMGGGLFEIQTTTATPTSNVDDQVLASGAWNEKILYPLVMIDSTSGVAYKASAAPTLTSVTGSVDGALTVDDDYIIVADSNAPSGYSIMLLLAGATLTTIVQDITIVYASVTPIASSIIYAGSSTKILTAYAARIKHTDDNGKIRQLDLFSVDSNSGGFQFNFKGANEDGLEEMPISYTAKLNTSLVNNRQLMSWTIEDGAQ